MLFFLVEMKEIKTIKTNCNICNADSYSILTTGKDYEYKTCNNIFRIAKCNNCSHIYLNPKPKLSEFSMIYQDNYYAYDFPKKKLSLARLGKGFIEKGYIKLYKNLIDNSGSILDIGCGDGRLLSLLKTAKNCNWKLYGLDFNKKGNKITKEKGIKIYEGKFEEARFKKESFDLVIMNEILEHLYDPYKSLIKVKEMLKPKGYLIIETPCLGSWDYKLFKNSYWGGYHIPRHLNIFSRNTIKLILKKAKFDMVEEKSLLSPPFWILSVHNRLYDKGWNQKIVKFFNFYNPILLILFTIIDLVQMRFGHTSTMRIIAKKNND